MLKQMKEEKIKQLYCKMVNQKKSLKIQKLIIPHSSVLNCGQKKINLCKIAKYNLEE